MDDCGRRMLSFEVPLDKIATCFARNPKEDFREHSPANRREPFLRIGMSQLGHTFVIVIQVVKNGEFDIFGDDPSGWNNSFVALESFCPNLDLPLWIKWSRHFCQPTVFSSVPLNDFRVSIPLLSMVLESEDMSQEADKFSGPQNMMKRGMIDQRRKLTWLHNGQ